MQTIGAPAILPDVDHPAGDDPVAKHADAPVVERIPFPEGVRFLQSGKFSSSGARLFTAEVWVSRKDRQSEWEPLRFPE